jgi:hypothetical protein
MSSATIPSDGGLGGAGTNGATNVTRAQAAAKAKAVAADELAQLEAIERGQKEGVVDSPEVHGKDADNSGSGGRGEKREAISTTESGAGDRIGKIETAVTNLQEMIMQMLAVSTQQQQARDQESASKILALELRAKKAARTRKSAATRKGLEPLAAVKNLLFAEEGRNLEKKRDEPAVKFESARRDKPRTGFVAPKGGGDQSPLFYRAQLDQLIRESGEKKRATLTDAMGDAEARAERQRQREEQPQAEDMMSLEDDSAEVSEDESVQSREREELLDKLPTRGRAGQVPGGEATGKGKTPQCQLSAGQGASLCNFSEPGDFGAANGGVSAEAETKARVYAAGMAAAGKCDGYGEQTMGADQSLAAWKGPGKGDGFFNHPALAPVEAEKWRTQFAATNRPGTVLDGAEAVRRAHSPVGLVYVGPGFALATFKIPNANGSPDFSGKRLNPKNPCKGFYEGEANAAAEWLNPERAQLMEHLYGALGDFPPASKCRLSRCMQQMQDAAGGDNYLDHKAGRDSSLTLQPVVRRERVAVVERFRAWTNDKYARLLTPAIGGRDAAKYIKTREMQLGLFVLGSFISAFSSLSLLKLMERVEERWLEHRRGDEETRGMKQVGSELADALRLAGQSCPQCGEFGSTEQFCSNMRCTKPKEADSTGGAKATAPKKKEAPIDYWNKQSDLAPLKPQASMPYGSASSFGLLGGT